jgi:hypothetical protein
MRKILLIILACALASPSMAKKGRKVPTAAKFQSSLSRLDPQTRLEQVCDLEAMKRIRQEKKVIVDRARGSASADAKTEVHKLTATGGAFRSKGDWYELSYVCNTSPDHLKVLSFVYQTGNAIPKAKWEEFGLWQ